MNSLEPEETLLIEEPDCEITPERTCHGPKLGIRLICSNKYVALTGILAASGGILFGYDLGVASGAVPQLHLYFDLSCFQQEMVVASMLVGALVASFCAGYIVDFFGRRNCVILSGILYAVGAIIAAVCPNYSVLLFGRVVLGIAMSLSSTSECVYVSEIAPAKFRGTLVSFNELGITLGFLLAFCTNAAFAGDAVNGWRWMFGLSTIFAFVIVVAAAFLPMSPRFLLAKNQVEKAQKELAKIRQLDVSHPILKHEWVEMKAGACDTGGGICGLRWNKTLIYSFCIGFGLVFAQQMTGQPNLLFYASTVLVSLGFESNRVASMCSVGLGVVKLVSTVLCIWLVDKFSRKLFLVTGCIVMALSLLTITGVVLHSGVGVIESCLNDTGNIVINSSAHSASVATEDVKWVVFVSLITFVSGYAFSFGPITWIILGEVFPTNVRGLAFSFTTSLNWGLNLLISSTFLDFSRAAGSVGWPFLMNSILALTSIMFLCKFVPETKGKSLEEIQSDISQRTKKFCCFFGS